MIDNSEFYVGWGTLSLINAGLAQAKGRSGLNWWLLSLLLGPLGTLLIVLLKPFKKEDTQDTEKNEFHLQDYRQQ